MVTGTIPPVDSGVLFAASACDTVIGPVGGSTMEYGNGDCAAAISRPTIEAFTLSALVPNSVSSVFTSPTAAAASALTVTSLSLAVNASVTTSLRKPLASALSAPIPPLSMPPPETIAGMVLRRFASSFKPPSIAA